MSGARPWLRSESIRSFMRGVAERDHAALPRRQLLVGVEAEHGRVAAAADRHAVGVDRAERLAGVLDDRQAEPLERRQVGREAEDVHRQQRLRALRDRGRGGRRVEVERDRVDVGEHRPRALVEHRVGRGDERERARDDLVALLHADRPQREVQAGGAARDRAGVRRRRAAPRTPARTRARAGRATAGPSAAPRARRPPPPGRGRAGRAGSDVGRARRHVAARVGAGRVPGRVRPGWIAYSSESTSASQEASMTFSETPIEPHTSWPSDASSSTRVTASVPLVSSRMRTLKLTSAMSSRCGWLSRDRRAQRLVERVDRAVALRGADVALAVDPDLDRRLGLDLAVGALLDDRRATTRAGTAARSRPTPCAAAARTSRRRPRSGSRACSSSLTRSTTRRAAASSSSSRPPRRARRTVPLPDSSEISSSRRCRPAPGRRARTSPGRRGPRRRACRPCARRRSCRRTAGRRSACG